MSRPEVSDNQLRHMFGDVNRLIREAYLTLAALKEVTGEEGLEQYYSSLKAMGDSFAKDMIKMGVESDGVTLGYETTDD